MRPGPARSGKHLIIKFARIVFGKKFGHEFSLSPPLRRANKKERVNYMPSPQSSPTGLVDRAVSCSMLKQGGESRIIINIARRSGRSTSASARPLSAVANTNFCSTAILGRKNVPQKWCCPAHPVFCDLLRCSGSNDLTAGITRLRADIDNVIRFRHYAEFVLNHDDGMTVVYQPVQQIQQQFDVGHMQPNRRFL